MIELGYADWIGWIVGIGCATLLSWCYGRFVAPSLSHQDRIVRAMATLGLAFMIMGLAQWYWGDTPRRLILPTDSSGINFNGRRLISHTRLLALCLSISITLTMALFLVRTNFGLKMRGLQSNRVLSGLLGVRVKRVDSWVWVIAGVLAGVTGLFMGNMIRLNPTVLTFLVIPALAAAVVGRLKSLPLTVFGGLLIGLVESMVIFIPTLSRYGSSTAFVVAIVSLLWYQRQGIALSRDNSHLE